MAVTAKAFSKFSYSLGNKEVDLNSDTIKCALFTNAHAPDQDIDQYYDGAHGMTEVAEDATPNGYSTGGAAVGLPILTQSTPSYEIFMFDGNNPSWEVTAGGFTYRYAVFYDDTPGANKPLISYVDFGEDIVAVEGTHTIVLDENGIAIITVS